jgi:hypothetical protein
LLVWIIRTAAAGALVRGPCADRNSWCADQPGTDLGFGRTARSDVGPEDRLRLVGSVTTSTAGPLSPVHVAGPDQVRGPANGPTDNADQEANQSRVSYGDADKVCDASETNAAAVAAYQASIQVGTPFSERKLAAMFGMTSRRWARSRMAEARQSPTEPVIGFVP